PCTTEIASFDRFVDFIAGDPSNNGERYDIIIFDTAPTGHTIRLLELPVDWSKHIEESAKGSGNTCIGPVASIQESKKRYDEATGLLGDPERTKFIFVLQPEKTSIYETKRSSEELKTIGVKTIELIINGILPREVCEHPFFQKRYEMQQQYLKKIEEVFHVPKKLIYQRDGEIKGIDRIRNIASDLFGINEASFQLESKAKLKPASFIMDFDPILNLILPHGQTRAIFFTGKGGVGKTTVSCITAYYLASRGYKTLLLTTDPASHIGEVLEQKVDDRIQKVEGVDNLWAVIIDQKRAVEEYKQRILNEAKQKYSEDMLTAIREELESPCTEEMAAFEKFMNYVESDEYDLVIFDTAPTGHTLRLLELTFDYSEQVGLMVTTTEKSERVKSEIQKRLDRIIARMKDPDRSVFAFVVYPESTPVMEAYRAMLDLKEAGIPTQFVVANQVLLPEYCTNEYFSRRRLMQEKYLAEIKELFRLPMILMPLLENEIRGMGMIKQAAELLFSQKSNVGQKKVGT
ncbi:MAG TPA: TRC40/GET3/ArsA family transport-energizing ATPase, partial [Thermodesulfobacteriota bacterium]|nr:TRC40/GET3/ArsA family transport-energizing ATPase [Thermodesulfobacteriota bacterium]